jgi:uncharacterized protein (TIGR00369 family)
MTAVSTERTRTFTWEDPMSIAGRAREMSGIDFLQAMIDGEIPPPPIARAFGFTLDEVGEGRAVFSGVPEEFHYNPIGVVHAGLALTLMDSALGCAVMTTLPAGQGYTTLETKGNMVRAISADTGRIVCEAQVVHAGRKVATSEARVTAADTGKVLAHGTSTCLIVG